MGIKKRVKNRTRVQYAALPYRRNNRSGVEVLLVTSQTTKRWIIPKGWPLDGQAPHVTAAHEALEEAGLIGTTSEQAIGSYSYGKRLKTGTVIECEVHVFPMQVTGQARNWPEKSKREVQWFSLSEAAAAIDNPVLRRLIGSLRAARWRVR